MIHEWFAKLPSGSPIVFNYADDTLFEEKGMSNRVQNMVQMASASGEPIKMNSLVVVQTIYLHSRLFIISML